MFRYAMARIAIMIPTLLCVLFLTFVLGYYGPLDPAKLIARQQMAMGLNVTEEEMARLRHDYGLDRPLLVQFGAYLDNLLHGDLGMSYATKVPVFYLISKSLPTSLLLAAGAGLILFVVGIPLGAVAALRHNTWLDYAIVGTSLFLNAVPIYVLGPLLMIILVLYLHLMPVPRGFQGPFAPSTFLFYFLLCLGPMATIIRQTRAGVLDVLTNDYVRTAHAKGLPPRAVVLRHVLKNAAIPVVTALGMMVSSFITGTVFLDTMFNIPGFGRVFSTALSGRDFTTIYACVVLIAIFTMLANLIVDLIYPLLDPRVVYK